ncbi:hypothetical protein GMMP15_580012 [Candidatus Magnetomoraceae bacterium gMMP-15]
MNIPLVYIRFDAIIFSYLGETAGNLRKVFNFIEENIWIVLFDEFDIIGKNRDDNHEHGEIKRVVNNFLQMLDNFKGDRFCLQPPIIKICLTVPSGAALMQSLIMNYLMR